MQYWQYMLRNKQINNSKKVLCGHWLTSALNIQCTC